MKLMNDEQILGIKNGIEQGFIENGYSLSEREQLIVSMTVKSTVDVIEELLKRNK